MKKRGKSSSNPDKASEPRLYRRRDFIGAGLTVGIGAAIGSALGRGYEIARDKYRTTVRKYVNIGAAQDRYVEAMASSTNPVERVVGKTAEAIEEPWKARADIYNKVFKRNKVDQAQFRQKYKTEEPTTAKADLTAKAEQRTKDEKGYTTRRGFLRSLLGLADRYPTSSGAVTGGVLGGAKAGINLAMKYPDRKEVRDLRKDLTDLKESRLETYAKKTPGGDYHPNTITLILGLSGLIASVLFSARNLTGLAIVDNIQIIKNPFLNLGIILISLALITISLRKRYLNRTNPLFSC